jgi:hypothetical protein
MRTTIATSIQPVVAGIFDMSAGRLGASTAAVIGLIGVVLGGLALARSAGRHRFDTGAGAAAGLRRATVALVLGPIAIGLGGLVAATADGELGAGNGLGGAIVAIVLGLIASVLGGLARARGSWRDAHRDGSASRAA